HAKATDLRVAEIPQVRQLGPGGGREPERRSLDFMAIMLRFFHSYSSIDSESWNRITTSAVSGSTESRKAAVAEPAAEVAYVATYRRRATNSRLVDRRA